MLFNSYAFILGFMPLTLLLFHGLRVAGLTRSSIGLLGAADLRIPYPPPLHFSPSYKGWASYLAIIGRPPPCR